MKVYKIKVTEIDTETGNKKELMNEKFANCTILADNLGKDTFTQFVQNESAETLSDKIINSGNLIKEAAMLASTFLAAKRMTAMLSEDALKNIIDGGGQ